MTLHNPETERGQRSPLLSRRGGQGGWYACRPDGAPLCAGCAVEVHRAALNPDAAPYTLTEAAWRYLEEPTFKRGAL